MLFRLSGFCCLIVSFLASAFIFLLVWFLFSASHFCVVCFSGFYFCRFTALRRHLATSLTQFTSCFVSPHNHLRHQCPCTTCVDPMTGCMIWLKLDKNGELCHKLAAVPVRIFFRASAQGLITSLFKFSNYKF